MQNVPEYESYLQVVEFHMKDVRW